jgi:SAM-dependent methyltransferase
MRIIEKIIDREMADTWRESVKKDVDSALRPKLISGRVYPTFFPMTQKEVVLNLGCGLGAQAVVYRGCYRSMIGVDIDPDKLSFAKGVTDRYNLAFFSCCCDVEMLPFPETSFDAIIAVDVIEHVLRPEKLISEAFRVLKKQGLLLITFPCLLDRWKHFLLAGKAFGESCRKDGPVRAVSGALYGGLVRGAQTLFHKNSLFREQGEDRAAARPFNPDTHKHEKSPSQWGAVIEAAGFRVIKSRSTTLFPPLHALGVAKFWFTNDWIFKIDSLLSSQRILKNHGQSMVCLARKG